MKLLTLKGWDLKVSEEIWGLVPFSKILKRDKGKEKEMALKEVLFIYFFSDIKSDYILMEEGVRILEIKKDIGLPDKWKKDAVIDAAIDICNREVSVIEKLYIQSLKGAKAVGNFLEKSEELLNERDKNDRPIYKINDIANGLKSIPKVMSDLKSAYKEVIKEREDNSNKKKGSKSFNIFEDGINI